ncbi:MAG: Sec-independent protein translocase protein TatC [Candidatus Hydrogenedentes bacterium ADurb.Bin101]|nr:MAG: Sec-independent protein translocase protein TatC [Candidatus Hydrogenedentes bacterium ADurb.Bin101]HOC68771.1 twin-arginine translocase subunit TatC [Candidatus Hydrogenedentota bacterium]
MVHDEKRMSFTEHLGELRTRIIRSCIALTVAVIACYAFSNQIFELLAWPLKPLSSHGVIQMEQEGDGGETEKPADETKSRDLEWTVLNPLEFILVKIRIAGYGGLVIAFPFIVWQICAFIFPGLYSNERRVVQILMAGCSSLGILGVGVAYFGVFPLVLPYLLEWIPAWVQVQLRLNETLSIIIKGLFGFAIAFQFPMAVLILVYMGLLTPQTLKKYRKMSIIGMSVVAAVLTPPDPFSMLVMLLPLVILYEFSIWLSYLVIRRKSKEAAE